MQKLRLFATLGLILIFAVGCKPNPDHFNDDSPFIPAGMDPATPTPLPMATSTPAPTATPTREVVIIPLTATVWETYPQTPVLMYHRFQPDPEAESENFTTALTDFEQQLNTLYEQGFSLVGLEDWLKGHIVIPEGRRPLIISFDDLFYADQISLDSTGQPAAYSGAGLLWQFSQSHPNFGFHLALFYNFGDKAYGNTFEDGKFTVTDGWRQDRAEAIVWGIQNGAIPLNHFYEHPFLNELTPEEIEWQLTENDRALREALALVSQSALAEKLPNILALPYVIWPETEEGKEVLFSYVSPEGRPVEGIVEGDYAVNAKLLKAPFSPDFDPWHIPRVIGSQEAIGIILDMVDQIPTAQKCDLGEQPDTLLKSPAELSTMILSTVKKGDCTEGFYVVGDSVFQVQNNSIIQLMP